MELLSAVKSHQAMRFASDGTPVSRTLSDLFQADFRSSFNLSEEQYYTILRMFDLSGLQSAGVDWAVRGTDSHMRRCFVSDKTSCCGRLLRVRWVSATVYERDEVHQAWNVVKSCKNGCGTRYFWDRKVMPGFVSGAPVYWHAFRAWSDGCVPAYICSKSGHAIMSTDFLTSIAVLQAEGRQVTDREMS